MSTVTKPQQMLQPDMVPSWVYKMQTDMHSWVAALVETKHLLQCVPSQYGKNWMIMVGYHSLITTTTAGQRTLNSLFLMTEHWKDACSKSEQNNNMPYWLCKSSIKSITLTSCWWKFWYSRFTSCLFVAHCWYKSRLPLTVCFQTSI